MEQVLVAIPTYKRPHRLRACIGTVLAQSAGDFGYSVVVVDNDPDLKQGAAVASSLGLPSVIATEPGISSARNRILEYASRETSVDFIAMLDDDELASPDWLAALMRTQRATSADIIGGPALPEFEELPSRQAVQFWAPADRPTGPIALVEGTGNCMISCRCLFELDWPKFDPRFGLTGGGDEEWFRRLRHRGATFAWASDATIFEVVPPNRATMKWILHRTFRYGNSAMRIALVHADAKEAALHLAKAAVISLTAPIVAFGLLHPVYRARILEKWSRTLGKFAGLLGFVYREYA